MLSTTQPADESVLVEVDRGIYSLDGKLDFDVPGRLIVAMHPYFFYPPGLDVPYVRNIEKIIANYPGAILVGEEAETNDNKLKRTAQRFYRLGRFSNSYFVKTIDGGLTC